MGSLSDAPPSYEEHDQNNQYGNGVSIREVLNQSAPNHNQEKKLFDSFI